MVVSSIFVAFFGIAQPSPYYPAPIFPVQYYAKSGTVDVGQCSQQQHPDSFCRRTDGDSNSN